jgi:hypothetical protein
MVGRKPLWSTERCNWIVRRIRELAEEPNFKHARRTQYVKRNHPQSLEMRQELEDAWQLIHDAPIEKRKAWINDDAETPLEESRAILAEFQENGIPQQYNLPPPNQFFMNKLFEQVAIEATQKFQKKCTIRNVKDCVAAWMKFEKSFTKNETE